MRGVMGAFGEAPRDIIVEEAAQARKELDTQLQQFNAFLNTEVAGFNKKALQAGSSTLFAGDPVTRSNFTNDIGCQLNKAPSKRPSTPSEL